MFPQKPMNHGKRIVSDVRPPERSHAAPVQLRRPVIRQPIKNKRNFRRWVPRVSHIIFVGVICALIIASLFWSSSLALTITPRVTSFRLEKDMKFVVDAQEISYDVVKRGEGKSRESQKYSKRASGTIIVFNNFSSEPQVLIERTRFQTPTGLLFRSTARVTVPGKKGDKPGSVEVSVVADEPSEKYNIGLSDFTIPGFVGTPKFQKFFARSKMEIAGGATGEGRVIGKKEADELLAKLEIDAKRELEGSIKGRIPSTVVAFSDTVERPPLVRLTDPPVGAPSETFFGEVRGSVRTLGVEKKAFSQAIARVFFKDQSQAAIYELASSPETITKNVEMDYASKKMTLTLTGTIRFRGIIDIEELQKRVLNANNDGELDTLFASFPGIAKVEKTFRPAFFKRVPGRLSHLKITVRDEGIDTTR